MQINERKGVHTVRKSVNKNKVASHLAREEAIKSGLKFYFTGLPCSKGHVTNRYVSTHQCKTCNDEHRALASSIKKKAEARRLNSKATSEKMSEYRKRNAEKIKASQAEYRKNNRESIRFHAAKYDAFKGKATPSWDVELTDMAIKEAYRVARSRGEICGFPWEVDHKIPLRGKTVCGLNTWRNIQVIPASVNKSKSNRLEDSYGA